MWSDPWGRKPPLPNLECCATKASTRRVGRGHFESESESKGTKHPGPFSCLRGSGPDPPDKMKMYGAAVFNSP